MNTAHTRFCESLTGLPPDYIDWLKANQHVWEAFRDEARRMVAQGRVHYSSKTILEYLRHQSAIREAGSQWKLNNNWTAYLARTWNQAYPMYSSLFTLRETRRSV